MIKWLRISCVLPLLCMFLAIIVGKNAVKHFEYNTFSKNAKYYTESIESVHETFHEADEILIDDKNIDNIDTLINKSPYVLRVRVSDNPYIYGNGFINNVEVTQVIKGEDSLNLLKKKIKIYSLVSTISLNYVEFYNGNLPLRLGDEYIVFVQKAKSPNIKGLYVFPFIRYGYFSVSENEEIFFTNYTQSSSTLESLQKYDYILTCNPEKEKECADYINKYKKLKKDLLNYQISK